jgi:osmotically-inducible protein OsmY
MKPSSHLFKIAGLALCFFFAMGCGTSQPKNLGAGLIQQRVTSERAQNALRRDSTFDYSRVTVRTENDSLVLEGTVDSENARLHAMQVLEQMPEAGKVVNRLRVVPR